MKKKQADPAVTPITEPVQIITPVTPVSPPSLKLSDIDKMALDLAKERKLTALAEAKTAMANNEKAELTYRYTILQIYYKYGLKEGDLLSEDGSVIFDGANKQ